MRYTQTTLPLVQSEATLADVIEAIDRSGSGIALVVNEDRLLLGALTDGDVRRALLDQVGLAAPAVQVLARKLGTVYAQPITAHVDSDPAQLRHLMQHHAVRQIPLLNADGQVSDLVTMEQLLPGQPAPLSALVMAGGFGTRLRPLTEDLPKPMLPVGGRPLLERIITQLRNSGVAQVNVTTHYLPEKIMDHFGDGGRFGVDLRYVNEDTPLGTGGALGLIDTPRDPLLVINGDILTDIDFRAMHAFHREQGATVTLAVRRFEMAVPYGVIEGEGASVVALREKPTQAFLVNAGIYLLEPDVYAFVPRGQAFNMTDLVGWVLAAGKPVASFLVREYWLDIGQPSDYERAQADAAMGRI